MEDKFKEDEAKDKRSTWGQLQYSRPGWPGLRYRTREHREKKGLREVLEVDSLDLCNSLDVGIVLERWGQDDSHASSCEKDLEKRAWRKGWR